MKKRKKNFLSIHSVSNFIVQTLPVCSTGKNKTKMSYSKKPITSSFEFFFFQIMRKI